MDIAGECYVMGEGRGRERETSRSMVNNLKQSRCFFIVVAFVLFFLKAGRIFPAQSWRLMRGHGTLLSLWEAASCYECVPLPHNPFNSETGERARE